MRRVIISRLLRDLEAHGLDVATVGIAIAWNTRTSSQLVEIGVGEEHFGKWIEALGFPPPQPDSDHIHRDAERNWRAMTSTGVLRGVPVELWSDVTIDDATAGAR